MENNDVKFIGPGGSGKSTTLCETFYLAKQTGKNVFYVDLGAALDSQYEKCSAEGFYCFIDNAQKLNDFPCLVRMLTGGRRHVCLAFSATILQTSGDRTLRCRIRAMSEFRFVPFTTAEIQNFIRKNCPGKTYNNVTTLPLVVSKCLLSDKDYSDYISTIIRDIFLHLTSKLTAPQEATYFANIFKLLYMFIHLEDGMQHSDKLDLLDCGLIFQKADRYQLVYQRDIVLSRLCQVARSHYNVFSVYDVGGAEELLFSDSCRRGEISAVCRGSPPRTITGRGYKDSTLRITCDSFLVQQEIGSVVSVPPGPTCSLIKLAQRHPAIDFIIYSFRGSVASKVLYFVQVSSQTYQSRDKEKKLSAVTVPSPLLDNKSPYNFYRNYFNMNTSSEVYYIYSTTAVIPSDDTFSRNNRDKTSVYFHQLHT
jgi:hypothetical protein